MVNLSLPCILRDDENLEFVELWLVKYLYVYMVRFSSLNREVMIGHYRARSGLSWAVMGLVVKESPIAYKVVCVAKLLSSLHGY